MQCETLRHPKEWNLICNLHPSSFNLRHLDNLIFKEYIIRICVNNIPFTKLKVHDK